MWDSIDHCHTPVQCVFTPLCYNVANQLESCHTNCCSSIMVVMTSITGCWSLSNSFDRFYCLHWQYSRPPFCFPALLCHDMCKHFRNLSTRNLFKAICFTGIRTTKKCWVSGCLAPFCHRQYTYQHWAIIWQHMLPYQCLDDVVVSKLLPIRHWGDECCYATNQ